MKEISLADELLKFNKVSVDDDVLDHIENIITSNVFSSLKDGESSIKIDLYIGDLYIIVYNDSISYEFTPSKSLMNKLKSSIDNNEDDLILEMNEKINKKLYKIYRELLK